MTVQNPTAPNSIVVLIGEDELLATKKAFSTGSVGYYAGGKIDIDGQRYQVSMTATLIGSKPDKA